MPDSSSRPLDIDPAKSFKELSQEAGALARAMHSAGFGFTHKLGKVDTDGVGVIEARSAENWTDLDFTGVTEEAQGTTRVEKVLAEIQYEAKFTIQPEEIWPLLYQYAPHERHSEYKRLNDYLKQMKKELARVVKSRRLLLNFVKSKRTDPPLPEHIVNVDELQKDHDVLLALDTQAKELQQRVEQHREEFRQRGHKDAHKAIQDLVELLTKGHPGVSHISASGAAERILRAWAPELALGAGRIRNIAKDRTIRKNPKNRKTARKP